MRWLMAIAMGIVLLGGGGRAVAQNCTQGCESCAQDCMIAADDCIDRRYGCGPFLPALYESPLQGTYVTADFVTFLRDRSTGLSFATLGNSTDVVLDTDDFESVYQPGLRVLIGRRLGECWAIEGSFLGLFEWNEETSIRDRGLNPLGSVGNLFSPMTNFGDPPVIGLDFNSQATVELKSQFNNAELNLRQQLYTPPSAMRITAIYGLRYISLNEQFQYRTRSQLPDPAGTRNDVNVATTNDLFGLQAGGMFDLNLHERCWIGIEAKGMLFRNSATQNTTYNVGPLDGDLTTYTGSHDVSRAILGADVAVTLVWAFSPSILGRVGYQAIFLDGLALGADNFVQNAPFLTTGPTLLDNTGHLALHGPFAGLTITW